MQQCRRGHDLTPENIYTDPQGLRRCRVCCRINDHRRNLRVAAAKRRAAAQCSLDFTPPAPAPAAEPWRDNLAWGRERIAHRVREREKARADRAAAREAEREREKADRKAGKRKHAMTLGEYLDAMDGLKRPVDPREREWIEVAA